MNCRENRYIFNPNPTGREGREGGEEGGEGGREGGGGREGVRGGRGRVKSPIRPVTRPPILRNITSSNVER